MHINDKSHYHDRHAHDDHDRNSCAGEVWDNQENKHDNIEHNRADLAAPHRSAYVLFVLEQIAAEAQRDELFKAEGYDKDYYRRIFYHDAEHHRGLHGLIRNRVQNFSDISDLVCFSCDLAVKDIRCGRGRHTGYGKQIFKESIGIQVQYNKGRNQKEPEVRKNIRNREQVFFIKMHSKLIIFHFKFKINTKIRKYL